MNSLFRYTLDQSPGHITIIIRDVTGHFTLQVQNTSNYSYNTGTLTVQMILMFTLELVPVATIVDQFVVKIPMVKPGIMIQTCFIFIGIQTMTTMREAFTAT